MDKSSSDPRSKHRRFRLYVYIDLLFTMQIPDALEALSEYPSSPGDAPDGKYAVRSGKKKHVDSSGPDIEYTSWFRTPVSFPFSNHKFVVNR